MYVLSVQPICLVRQKKHNFWTNVVHLNFFRIKMGINMCNIFCFMTHKGVSYILGWVRGWLNQLLINNGVCEATYIDVWQHCKVKTKLNFQSWIQIFQIKFLFLDISFWKRIARGAYFSFCCEKSPFFGRILFPRQDLFLVR